jgi:predicted RecA/RadA family phage recombinase
MKNYIQPGENVTFPAPYALTAGDGAMVGSMFGVAQETAANGADVVLARRGVYALAKTSAQAWTQGARIYWNATSKVCTKTATGNTLIGVAHAAAANPSPTGEVLLDGAVR